MTFLFYSSYLELITPKDSVICNNGNEKRTKKQLNSSDLLEENFLFMDEPFEIPVSYKGQELLFPARLSVVGFTHKFLVTIDGLELFFEQDNNGNYRAVANTSNQQEVKNFDTELLKAIAESIESILK
jgi:hypothetical protein